MGNPSDGTGQSDVIVCVGHLETRYVEGTGEEVLVEVYDAVSAGHSITECGPGTVFRKVVPEGDELRRRDGDALIPVPSLPLVPPTSEGTPSAGSEEGSDDNS